MSHYVGLGDEDRACKMSDVTRSIDSNIMRPMFSDAVYSASDAAVNHPGR